MADYDQYGNPIPPSDAETARENTDTSTSADDTAPAQPAVWDSGVGADTVVVTANAQRESSVLGLFLLLAAAYFIFQGD